MKQRIGIGCMILGLVLLLGAAGLYFANRYEAQQAQASADYFLPIMMDAIDKNATQPDPEPGDDIQPAPYEEMPAVEIDGYDFIGYISVPRLNLQLPVLAETSKKLLKKSPCRYAGATYTGDLVIGGHNHSHFGPLHKAVVGDDVYFTDMNGVLWHYQVVMIETLKPSQSDVLTNGEHDLSLYTCTYSARNRLTLRCDRVIG